MKATEKFICELYVPKTSLSTVKDLRWWLFRKKQAESERLPPTQGALHQAELRAHYQVTVWNNDIVANPDIPSPEKYGWEKHENRWLPVMTPFTWLTMAARNNVQATDASTAKMGCHVQTSILVMMKRMTPARILLVTR